ncbi:hypothetical protein GCM10027184_17390 [Saccharothrix stipae]
MVEDEQSVGGFASYGSDEPFGVGVGSRTPWRRLHDLDACAGETRVERGGELVGSVAGEDRKSFARSRRSIKRLRVCGGVDPQRRVVRAVDRSSTLSYPRHHRTEHLLLPGGLINEYEPVAT